jgi:tetratricopeptide (TPR) repeat protein
VPLNGKAVESPQSTTTAPPVPTQASRKPEPLDSNIEKTAKAETKTQAPSSPAPKTEPAKASGKKSDAKNVAAEPAVPAGPPPIPPEATQQFERALTLLGGGDLAPAAKEFQHLSETYPDYSGPLTNLGIVYQRMGKLPDAEKALKSATERGEPSAAAFNQLGIVYRKLGRFKEADEAYTRALQIDPGYALAHLNLGVLCDMYLQQPQRALAEFERYLELTPNPDARVPAWVKELQGRTGGKPKAAESKPQTTGGLHDFVPNGSGVTTLGANT